jgi:hypothetical protein
MPDCDLAGSRGAGGGGRPPRAVSQPRRAAALLCLVSLVGALPAAAAPAPRLRALLKTARVAVAGSVTGTTSYDDDRVAVVDFSATTIFKGKPGTPPVRLALVELHEGSITPPLTAGQEGLAFLRPARRTSYLERTLPAGNHLELVQEHGAFIAAADAADAARQLAVMRRVVRLAGGATLSADELRRLTFDLLACDSPVLVGDGAAGLTDLGRDPTLTDSEAGTLRAALLRRSLPDRVRIALIDGVAGAHLAAMVPALQQIDSPPPVMEAAWRALDALGAGASEQQLQARLAIADAAIRTAAARELLRRSGAAAVPAVAHLAVRDADPEVRLAVIEAFGALGSPAALPTLEQAFVDPSETQRQAAARAIRAISGPGAIETLGRLTLAGPVESQRYAVVVLMTMNDPSAAPLLDRLGETHPDAKTRDLIKHGFPAHHH